MNEPWRELYFLWTKEHPDSADFEIFAQAFAAGWQALASLPELVEVLEAAKHCEEAICGVGQVSGWAASCRLATAIAALKARME